jgi:hypothetical protein
MVDEMVAQGGSKVEGLLISLELTRINHKWQQEDLVHLEAKV